MYMTIGEHTELTRVLCHLESRGWKLHSVSDGEDRIRTATIAEALAVVDSVEESWIYVAPPEGGKRHTLYVVLGNAPDGSEVIADSSEHPDIEAAYLD